MSCGTQKDVHFYRCLREMLRAILCCDHDELPRVRVSLSVCGVSLTFLGDFTMQLPDDKTVSATAAFVDAKDNPAKVDGAPVWATDRPDLLSVADNGDGTATITPVGPLGSGQVTCTADADLGAGVVPVILLGTVEVIAGQAVGGAINFGEPA